MNPHRNLFAHHPLIQLAVAFAAGICATPYVSIRVRFVLVIATILVLIFLIKQRLQLAGLVLLSAMFFAGVVLADLERRADESRVLKTLVEQAEGEPIALTG